MTTIYKMTDPSKRIYVGSTTRPLRLRIYEHRDKKKRDTYGWDKDNLVFEVLEICANSKRFSRENFWIKKLKANNKSPIAGYGCIGYKYTKEQREKRKEQIIKLAALKTSRMPKYIAISRETGEVLGPFQGFQKASKELGYAPGDLSRYVNVWGKTLRFYFEKDRGI